MRSGRHVRPYPSLATLLIVALAAVPLAARGREGEPEPPAPGTDQISGIVAAIEPVVEEIRGLRFKKPVLVERADDTAARRHFEDRMRTYWPEQQVRVEQDAYVNLGLLPARTDFKDSVLQALEEQAAGYYDPARDAFVVLSDMPGSMAPIIVAHELTHALDDQYFNIDAMLDAAASDSERTGGIAAVVEGSGTLVMTIYTVREVNSGGLTPDTAKEFQQSEAGQAKRLRATPQIVQRSLVGPYMLGMRFLLRGNLAAMPKDVVPKADLEQAFRDPPISWEQVIHPEKYWDPGKRDLPRPVTLPDLAPVLGDGWALEGQGILGELILAILTGTDIDVLDPANLKEVRGWTNPEASGWGGDRWQHYRRGDDTVTILATLWDTKKDAREFHGALLSSPRRTILRRGDAVILVAGSAGDSTEALAREALRSVRATERAHR